MSNLRKKYIFVTTSLINVPEKEKRESQYNNCIEILINLNLHKKYTIIIIENNGKRSTFLDKYCCFENVKIFYTNNNEYNNNKLLNKNPDYGIVEFMDIIDCIKEFNIDDNDFIVKLSGRYYLDTDNQFFKIVDNLDNKYNGVVKYGPYMSPIDYRTNDCVTGLIGYTAFYLKKIYPNILNSLKFKTCVEHIWADSSIPDEEIYIINGKIGLNICPLNSNYNLI
jgi:hypothetical protein